MMTVVSFWILIALHAATWVFMLLYAWRHRAVKTLTGEADIAGFLYDPYQDIFYSAVDAWQRPFGYCRLYDEAMAPLSLIVDAEPVRFSYGGKQWLIEFWKGQYGMTMGAEVGVYTTTGPDRGADTFYGDTLEEDFLAVSFVLRQDGEPVFSRNDLHWWLTGFKLGVYAETAALELDVLVKLKDRRMRDAFAGALFNLGYDPSEVVLRDDETVGFIFGTPRAQQPRSRNKFWEWLGRLKNRWLCDTFQALTGGLTAAPEKLALIRQSKPQLYRRLMRLTAPRKQFKGFGKTAGGPAAGAN